jgi:aminoglycoside phosphotransferase (APT) family kinase protein
MACSEARRPTVEDGRPHRDAPQEDERRGRAEDVTPDLADEDRVLLAGTLRELRHSILDRSSSEQLLHGEPHPANILDTKNGLLFIDFENAARGPVEYDLAWVPRDVSDRYSDADSALVDECRGVVLAIIAMHRWRRGDQHPSGRQSGVAFLDALRAGPPWAGLDEITW